MSFYIKNASNTINFKADLLDIYEKINMYELATRPNINLNKGDIIYYSGNLEIWDGTQWDTLINNNNTVFNNLTVNNSLNVYGYNLPKQASITYKIEKIGVTWVLTFFSSSQFNGLDLDASNNSADYSKGVIYLNKSACGINNIIDISVKMVYCDNPNTCLQVRPATLLFNSFIPPNPAPNQIILYTYVYDQFRVINDLDVDSAGSVFIFTANIFGY